MVSQFGRRRLIVPFRCTGDCPIVRWITAIFDEYSGTRIYSCQFVFSIIRGEYYTTRVLSTIRRNARGIHANITNCQSSVYLWTRTFRGWYVDDTRVSRYGIGKNSEIIAFHRLFDDYSHQSSANSTECLMHANFWLLFLMCRVSDAIVSFKGCHFDIAKTLFNVVSTSNGETKISFNLDDQTEQGKKRVA